MPLSARLMMGLSSTDPYWASTVMLLAGEGSNGSTTITDSSTTAATMTVAGNAAISTAQYRFGAASIAFDGTGDNVVSTATSSIYAFGTGDFTIEAWVYATAFNAKDRVIFDCRPTSGVGSYPLLYLVANTGVLTYYGSATVSITGSALIANRWYHVAVCRSAGSTRLFRDGVQTGSTVADTMEYLNGTSRPRIGASGFNAALEWAGYIDGVRVTKAARYTSDFAPPKDAHPTS